MGRVIKLIACDMDGTLLNDEKRVSDRTRQVLRKLKEENIAYTICTGRVATMVGTYARDLEITTPIITSNGAALWDPVEGKCIYENPVPKKEAREMVRYCQQHGIDCCVLAVEKSLFTLPDGRINKFKLYNQIAGEAGDPPMILEMLGDDLSPMDDLSIHKLLINCVRPGEFEQIEDYVKAVPNLDYVTSEKSLIDVCAVGVSKGAGVAHLMEQLHLTKEEVCTFGDYYNDISMMSVAGLPIAMENGCEEIKLEALYVTENNNADGVAKAIEQLIL
ncbi:MAG: Cof-type HAD-IIB family hydrolase [Lachnospiraceae bacterium]|jgi:Cof subfamily protein (haloacid dehalogenase superfamily)|nr:Cof-type HAD-IIB family hydrolase [Lachnospiraceae bacterium]MDD3614742.1 Cof-type HAD-IIB family hydrolase [Lachnospiraceae bacterium]